MTKKNFGCGRSDCCASTGICGQVTFGTGELDEYGYWEFPCEVCARAWEAESNDPALPGPSDPDENRAWTKKYEGWEKKMQEREEAWFCIPEEVPNKGEYTEDGSYTGKEPYHVYKGQLMKTGLAGGGKDVCPQEVEQLRKKGHLNPIVDDWKKYEK